jgi:hypothetical protein
MEQVEIERAYRIVGSLEKTARGFEERVVPALNQLIKAWRKRTLIGDLIAALLILGGFIGITSKLGQWDGIQLKAAWWDSLTATPMSIYLSALAAYLGWLLVHYGVRRLAAKSLLRKAQRLGHQLGIRGSLREAFRLNTKPWRSIFSRNPAGWGRRNRRRIQHALEDADRYVQDLNDRFTNPSGNPTLEMAAEQDNGEPLADAPGQRTTAAD